MSNNVFPVVLCGGYGTRLWPLSRKSYPKQFLKLNSKSKYSLLQQTQIRINNFESMFKVEIYDALGRLSFTHNKFSTANKLSLNISELERGIYILKLYNNNNISF